MRGEVLVLRCTQNVMRKNLLYKVREGVRTGWPDAFTEEVNEWFVYVGVGSGGGASA